MESHRARSMPRWVLLDPKDLPVIRIVAPQSRQRYWRTKDAPFVSVLPTCLSPFFEGSSPQSLQGIIAISLPRPDSKCHPGGRGARAAGDAEV